MPKMAGAAVTQSLRDRGFEGIIIGLTGDLPQVFVALAVRLQLFTHTTARRQRHGGRGHGFHVIWHRPCYHQTVEDSGVRPHHTASWNQWLYIEEKRSWTTLSLISLLRILAACASSRNRMRSLPFVVSSSLNNIIYSVDSYLMASLLG